VPSPETQRIFRSAKENAEALTDLAIDSFIEMRDKTASRTFRAKKKLDHPLEAALPGMYLPLYTIVTFTRIPYARACKIGSSMAAWSRRSLSSSSYTQSR
jgi:kynurenine 3-monooxygenase